MSDIQTENTKSSNSFTLYGLVLALFTFAIDQIHKYWMIYHFWPQKGCQPLPATSSNTCFYEVFPFMNYLMTWNKGISYGLFQQHDQMGKLLLVGFALAIVVGLIIWLTKVDNKLAALSIGLIIGGALGNAVDRYLYGAVADFFSLHAFGFYWYIFNIADVAIVAGVIGLMYEALFEGRKKVSNAS